MPLQVHGEFLLILLQPFCHRLDNPAVGLVQNIILDLLFFYSCFLKYLHDTLRHLLHCEFEHRLSFHGYIVRLLYARHQYIFHLAGTAGENLVTSAV